MDDRPRWLTGRSRRQAIPGFKIHVEDGAVGGPPSTGEVARKHRWRVNVLGNDNSQTPLGLYAFKASRPKREFDEVIMHHGQHEIYLPGKDRWSPVEISFYEPIGNDKNLIARFFWTWQKDVSNRLTAKMGPYINGFKRTVEYQLEAPGRGSGQSCAMPVWKYTLLNAWPIRVTPSDLDYTETSVSEVVVELRFDASMEM